MRCCCFLVAGVLLLSGCAVDSSQTVVEQQLRVQEDRIRQLDQQLTDARQKLTDQDLELAALREKRMPSGSVSLASDSRTEFAAEEYVAWGRVTSVQIHELTCGIVQQQNGGAAVQFFLQPLDDNLDIVKVAGRISVTVADASKSPVKPAAGSGGRDRKLSEDEDATKTPAAGVVGSTRNDPFAGDDSLTTYSVGLTESRDRWASGLVASGFYLTVPLPDDFATDSQISSLDVTATLDLGQGRIYSDRHRINR